MDKSLEETLHKMGWTSGLRIPLANDENAALQNQVEKLMLQKAKLTQLYESEESRFDSIGKHLKFVKQQNSENQHLLTTYHQHLDGQEHKFLVTESEQDRVNQEIRAIEKESLEVAARIVSKQGDLDKGIRKMDKIKTESNWDNEALEAWEESLKKRDEDNELLKKFSREDEKKAKDLEAKRKSLQTDLLGRKQTLDKLLADLQSYEQILERTGKMFKQQKNERTALINQWQETVKNLKRRDELIEHTMEETSITQGLIRGEQEKLDEQNNFLNNEVANNKEVELNIAEFNLLSSKLRTDLNELIQYVLILNSEAGTLKRRVVSTANFLEKERSLGRNLLKEITFKHTRIAQLGADRDNLKKKLDNVKNSSMSASDRAKQLEQILEFEQAQHDTLTSDIERMQGILFRTQQNLEKLKEDARVMEITITGSDASMNLLKKHSQKVFNDLLKQQEIIYDLDFTISQMNSKLDKLEGQTIDDDKQVNLEKINELEKNLGDETEIKQMLQTQVNLIENEMRRLSSTLQTDNAQLSALKDKLQSEILSFEGGTKQTVAAKQRSQQKQVDENMLRLKVNQLENIMKHEDYNIYTMQKYRLELDMAMRERQIEINTNKEILFAKRRNLEEEKGRLKRDMAARHIKIEQLQKRFTIVMNALGKTDDGQQITVTYFKIKNAQEKYMLQEEGDQLDLKIKRTENEIVAMENTLRVVNTSNVTYKQSLTAVGEFDKEARDMNQLEMEISNITREVRARRKEITEKRHEVKDLKATLNEADAESLESKKSLAVAQEDYANLDRYVIEQKVKIDRTDRYLHTSMKNLDPRITMKYHKNLLIRQLQEANKSALQQLTEASTRYQDMTPNISRYLSDYDLCLPSAPRPLYTPSSSSGSSRSSKYYASGPYVSNLLLSFEPDPPSPKKVVKKRKCRPKSKV